MPRARERIATVVARHEAVAALREAQRTLDAHRAAAAEVCGSTTLAAALTLALAAGNVLNHGTRLGDAAGFRLRSLGKLGVCTLTLLTPPLRVPTLKLTWLAGISGGHCR